MPTPSLPPEILARPAAQSVRLIAQAYLDAAVEAARRMDDPKDTEALHDFRVALRRLRSTLRAYRAELKGSARPKLYRRFGEIADETNRVRDADVALAWLQPLTPELSTRERVGLRWLIGRIEAQRTKRIEHDLAEARRSFRGAERRLRNGLAIYRQALQPDEAGPDRPFAAVARGTALAQAQQLDQILAAVRAPDGPEVHRARIAAKRLRYLLEPLTEEVPATAAVVARLRTLQDRLGELHDVLELEHAVRTGVESVAAERAIRLFDVAISDHPTPEAVQVARRRDPKPGLVAVARRLRARHTSLFTALRANGLKTAGTWRREIEAALATLGVSTPAAPVPIPLSLSRRRTRRERRV
jgi:CHAD domain-containing protein